MAYGRMIFCSIKNLAYVLASLFLLSFAVFFIAHLAPGDPLASYYGERVEKMSPGERAWAEEKLGLHDPLPVQYGRWLSRALQGDMGTSLKYKRDVLEVIGDRAVNTLLLGGIGFVLIFVLALLLGILCAWYEGRWIDRIVCRVGTVTSCIPEFWLALVLILIFAVWLRAFPSSGAYSMGKETDLGDRMYHLVLPMAVVVLSHLWYYAYMIRSRIAEEIRADYVLLVRAKGLGRLEILSRHCLRNAMPSYLNIMALSVPHIMGGTYIIETVFSYPGLGTLSYESARYKDYDLLMALAMLSGALVIISGILAQAVNEQLDPRFREMGREGDNAGI